MSTDDKAITGTTLISDCDVSADMPALYVPYDPAIEAVIYNPWMIRCVYAPQRIKVIAREDPWK